MPAPLRLVILGLIALVAGPARGADHVTWSAAPAPESALMEAIERIVHACEVGDRAALLDVVAPEGRARAGAIAGLIMASPSHPVTDARAEVMAWDGREGVMLLTFTTTPAAPDPIAAAAGDGWVHVDVDRAALSLAVKAIPSPDGLRLVLDEGNAAAVTKLAADLVLEPETRAVQGALALDLRPRDGFGNAMLLVLPSSCRVRSPQPGVSLRGFGAGAGALLVRNAPREGDHLKLELEVQLEPPEGLLSMDGRLYLDTQWAWTPFAQDGPFAFEATLDVPSKYRVLSVGEEEILRAPEGRRRERFVARLPVDLAPIAVAPYHVDVLDDPAGRLELWRFRDVGGSASDILAELRDLVAFHAQRVAPLPQRVFRLAELPTIEGLATSRPSLIFMPSGLLAVREKRLEILSHEVAHQWWGNAVEPDSTSSWISEGMADAMRDLIVRGRFGEERWRERLAESRQAVLDQLGPATLPLAVSADSGGIVYSRGSLFVHALNDALGDDVFWRLLRTWFERFRGKEASTQDLRRVAEEVAGRPLPGVVGAWLEETALPVLDLSWTARPGQVSVVIVQEEPAFELLVPIRIASVSGARRDEIVRVAALRTEVAFDASEEVASVVLDPDNLLPRVRPDELDRYRRDEATACLVRGDATRARALLERAATVGLLDPEAAGLLFSARVLSGEDPARARAELDAVLAEIADPAERASRMLDVADTLRAGSSAAAALPLLEQLDREIDDGAAVTLRLGLALRQLGRETEARRALERAHERRPERADVAAALALPSREAAATDASFVELLKDGSDLSRALDVDHAVVRALPGGRALLLAPALRRIVLLGPAGVADVRGIKPEAAVDMALLDDSIPRVAVLEAQELRSRLVILDVVDGAARVVAAHEHGPSRARSLLHDGDALLLGIRGRDDATAWHRWITPVLVASAGPDDEDGLKRLRVEDDDRLRVEGTTTGIACFVPGAGLASVTGEANAKAVTSGATTLWQPLGGGKRDILALAQAPGGLAILVRSSRSTSPFEEDRDDAWIVVHVTPDGVVERPAPRGAAGLSVASDGTLVFQVQGDRGLDVSAAHEPLAAPPR
jgi:tetratricopeptide (TPR) repeat protein